MKFLQEENFDNKVSVITEAAEEGKDPEVFLEGIFLQANIKNRNGRIYPMDIMEPEVERYKKEYVDTNRALGELGHGCFVYDTFDVLTPNGWVPFRDIHVGDKVVGMNENGGWCLTTVTQKIEGQEPSDSFVYHFTGRHIDSTVTANHRFYCLDRNDNIVVKTAEELYQNSSHLRIIKRMNPFYDGFKESVTIPACNEDESRYFGNSFGDMTQPLTLNAKDFCAFLGFWLAEGAISGNQVIVSQNSGDVAEEYKQLLDRMGFAYSVKYKHTDVGTVNEIITFTDRRVAQFLIPLGTKYEKFVPQIIKELNPDSLMELLVWFAKGDGRKYEYESERKALFRDVFSVSEQLVHDLNYIAIKCGFSGKIRTQISKYDYVFADHLIESAKKSPLFIFTLSDVSGIHLDRRFLKIEKIKSPTNKAYCLTTESHNFYVRDNGKQYLSGNSGGPNIILDRVSHQITDIWRDGDYFKARAKILDTPFGRIAKALILEGIQLGVSSRALGSVIRRNGTDYVGKDFKIITAGDIVFEPSAQSAFPKGIVMEDLDWVYDEAKGEYVPASEIEPADMVEVPRALAEELLAKRQLSALADMLKKAK